MIEIPSAFTPIISPYAYPSIMYPCLPNSQHSPYPSYHYNPAYCPMPTPIISTGAIHTSSFAHHSSTSFSSGSEQSKSSEGSKSVGTELSKLVKNKKPEELELAKFMASLRGGKGDEGSNAGNIVI